MRRRGEQKRDGHDDDPSHRRQVSVGASGRIRVGRGARRLPSGGGLLRRRSRGARCRRVSRLRARHPRCGGAAHPTHPSRARCRGPRCRSGSERGPSREGGAVRDRRLGADLGGGGATRRRSRPCGRRSPRGDVYQVNLVQHLSAPFAGDPRGLAAALAPLRPLEPRAARRRGLGDRVRLAGAVARPPRPRGSGRSRSRARARSARAAASPTPRRTRPST